MLTKKALGLMIGALLSGALIGGEAAAGRRSRTFTRRWAAALRATARTP